MKRFVDLVGAFLTTLALCILPARADVIAGPTIAVGLLGIVLIIAIMPSISCVARGCVVAGRTFICSMSCLHSLM